MDKIQEIVMDLNYGIIHGHFVKNTYEQVCISEAVCLFCSMNGFIALFDTTREDIEDMRMRHKYAHIYNLGQYHSHIEIPPCGSNNIVVLGSDICYYELSRKGITVLTGVVSYGEKKKKT